MITMTFRHRFHAANDELSRIAAKTGDHEIREFWRKLVRPVTFFGLCSPLIFFGSKIVARRPGQVRSHVTTLEKARGTGS